MKKVLILIPDLRGGGAERVVVNLVNNFDSDRYQITLMTLFDVGVNKKIISDKVDYKYWLPFRIRGFWRVIKMLPADFLHRLIIKEKYDIEIAYLEGMVTKIISGASPAIKKIAWLHCELKGKEAYFFECYRNREEFSNTYEKFDRVVGVSKDVIESFKYTISDKVPKSVVYNTIDTDYIEKLLEEKVDDITIDSSKLKFITVGRLVEQKGYERLLKVFNDLNIKYKNIELFILGEGPLQDKLMEYIYKNNMKNVHLLGFKRNPYKYEASMDCFICSSFQEGFSTAVTEALIVGIPFITTACSGSKELCSGGAGICCDLDDESLKKTIELYINNRSIRDELKKNVSSSKRNFYKEESIKNFIKVLDTD